MNYSSQNGYLGSFYDNKKSGYGLEITPEGTYIGNFINDERNGFGVTFDRKHRLSKIGYWENGSYKNDDNLFKQKYSNGDIYIGQLENKQRNGNGFYFIKNGDFTIGSWKDGKLCGQGIVGQKGITCIGTFKDGLLNEICLVDSLEKGLFIGEYKDGHRFGYGVMDFISGDRYEGGWNGTHYHGKGVFYGADGEIDEGYYENSIMKETYLMCYKNSAVRFKK